MPQCQPVFPIKKRAYATAVPWLRPIDDGVGYIVISMLTVWFKLRYSREDALGYVQVAPGCEVVVLRIAIKYPISLNSIDIPFIIAR